MLNEISATIRKFRDVLILSSGSPTNLGEDSAINNKIQIIKREKEMNLFFLVIKAALRGFNPVIAAARSRLGTCKEALFILNGGASQYISKGKRIKRKTQGYAISKFSGMFTNPYF
jgi:hypothetical protein